MNARIFWCSCGVLLVSALPLGAGERLTIRVSPAIAFAPASVMVRVTIATDPDNRAVEVIAESADFYRSSRIQLDGDRAPRTHLVELRGLPSGHYRVAAVLSGAGGLRVSAQQQVVVNGERDGEGGN